MEGGVIKLNDYDSAIPMKKKKKKKRKHNGHHATARSMLLAVLVLPHLAGYPFLAG
jgi:hypothetical protein